MAPDRAPFTVTAKSAVLSQGGGVHQALQHRVGEAGIPHVAVPGQHVVVTSVSALLIGNRGERGFWASLQDSLQVAGLQSFDFVVLNHVVPARGRLVHRVQRYRVRIDLGRNKELARLFWRAVQHLPLWHR